MKGIYFIICFFSFSAFSQPFSETVSIKSKDSSGIQFFSGISWEDIKKMALLNNKYIFMDCFTTWCGPCREMNKKIFSSPEVGDFINDNFISVKVQFDTSSTDKEEIKKWYTTSHELLIKHHITVFPTYLFFSPDGNIVHRDIGKKSIKDFLSLASSAMDPTKQLITSISYCLNSKNYAIMDSLATTAKKNNEHAFAEKLSTIYMNDFLFYLPDSLLFVKKNMKFVYEYTKSYEDRGFDFVRVRENALKFDSILGKGASDKVVSNVIANEEVRTVLNNKKGIVNWNKLERKTRRKFGLLGSEVVRNERFYFYWSSHDWSNFSNYFITYFEKSRGRNIFHINNACWDIFEHCSDKDVLEFALKILDPYKERDIESMDTYANLLYKIGRTNDAVFWQTKALNYALEYKLTNGVTLYRSKVDKMKKGIPTWPN